MIAICKREFLSLFRNIIGWLFVAATMALYGLYFFLYNLVYGTPTITYTLSAVTIIFLIAAPILTMRTLAEERHNKTDQLILTAPVGVWEIVLGKFLALALTFGICVGLMALTPLFLTIFGTVKLVESYVALLGFLLYGLTSLAIGMFVSSLTESQVISAVLSFVFLFIGFMMHSVVEAVFAGEGIFAKILGAYDLMTPLEDLESGSLNFTSIVYYLSIIALFLFLTTQSIEKRRWTVSARRLTANVFSVTSIVVAIVAMISLNVIMSTLPENITVRDITTQKLYSITDDTKDYLKTIEEDVTIYVIGTKADVKESYPEIPKMLSRYKEGSSHIKVKYVNMDNNPTFASAYGSDSLSTGSVIVESEKRYKVLSPYDIYAYDIDYTTYSQTLSAYDGEGQVTSALQFVLTDDIPVVYTLTGHDEVALGADFTEAMEKANVDVKELNFLQSEGVPEDAAFVLINAPQSDFSKDDADKLIAYVEGGGALFITLDFGSIAELTNVKEVLAWYQVEPVEGVVADLDGSYYYQNSFYLLPEVASTEATADVSGSSMIFSPFSVGLSYNEEGTENTYTPLLTTSEQSVSKPQYADTETMGTTGIYEEITKEEGDVEGPFTVGLQVHVTGGGDSFIFGSTYLFTDAADQIVSYRNSQLFTGVLNTMVSAEEMEQAVVIPAKSYEATTLLVSAKLASAYGILFVIALPIVCIAFGVIIWYKRRKR